MEEPSKTISHALGRLAKDAHALLTATAHVTGEKVSDARNRLAMAAERGRETYTRAQAKAVEGARAADRKVHEHPYEAVAIGLGVGALVGYLIARQSSRGAEPPIHLDPSERGRTGQNETLP